MSFAIERVADACPKSKYKDDRHEWRAIMYEPISFSVTPKPEWSLRRCTACALTVLVFGSRGLLEGPEKSDRIEHAFFSGVGE